MAEQYYTSGKACKVLNIKPYQLKRLVDRGKIQRIEQETTNWPLYPKRQVDELAERIRSIEIISA